LSLTFFIPSDSEIYQLISYFDFILCFVFLLDFITQFFKAKNKWKYFYTVGWLDLLSSIPIVYEFRFIRLFRVFRVLRIIKSTRLLIAFIRRNKATSLYGFIVFTAFVTLVITTTAILYIEKDVGNIKTAEDALWWSFITITTVGYGDFYPVTGLGKLLASLLIFCGIASFGAVISYVNKLALSFKD
jgi:voltage-gated potassium channel